MEVLRCAHLALVALAAWACDAGAPGGAGADEPAVQEAGTADAGPGGRDAAPRLLDAGAASEAGVDPLAAASDRGARDGEAPGDTGPLLDGGRDGAVAADATPDAPPDAVPDAMPDAAPDATPDAAPDANADPPPLAALDAEGRLTLALGPPTPASPETDRDADGLDDAWEARTLDRLRPILRLDEAEPLLGDDEAVVALVGRLTPGPAGELRAFLMIGYSRDYGSCFGLSSHDGDSERVVLGLRPDVAGAVFTVVRAYTAAHEGTINDHGHVFEGAALADLEHADAGDGLRWVVYPSAGKHATYATAAECEAVAPFVPCLDEDCAPDGVPDAARFDLLPPVFNAGEPQAPLLDDLAEMGFPGDRAWADQRFCGGRARGGCSSPVREKLTVDPFDGR